MSQRLIERQEQALSQQQRLSARQMQYVRLLEMPLAELEENIRTEVDDNPALEPSSAEDGFPIALGVIRDVEAPTYDEAVNEQLDEVAAKKPYHSFMELLETNDIWEVS